MQSNINNIDLDHYDENYINYDSIDYNNSTEEIELPVAASFIYIDETINYYTDCNNRKLNRQ
uniref:Uncharacterized protein n=1 Tax=Chondria sp. (in: red algae) TaxID=1982705 RepID=A0A1Z1MCN2_9FLOR|nr:hypothetical protein [Chondria sp. (in: red algae)]